MIAATFDGPLCEIEDVIGSNLMLAMLVAANLQRRLRDMMTEDAQLDVAAFRNFILKNRDAAKNLQPGSL